MSFPALFPQPYLIMFWCSCSAHDGIADQMIDSPAHAWSVCTHQRRGGSQARPTVTRTAPARTVSEVACPADTGRSG